MILKLSVNVTLALFNFFFTLFQPHSQCTQPPQGHILDIQIYDVKMHEYMDLTLIDNVVFTWNDDVIGRVMVISHMVFHKMVVNCQGR
jgi:hypothetical protein